MTRSRVILLALACVAMLVATARAKTITDAAYGFTFDVPAGYVRVHADSDMLYGFVVAGSSPDISDATLAIRRAPSDSMTVPGGSRVAHRRWNGADVDVLQADMSTGSVKMNGRVVQLPLAGGPIQVLLIEPSDKAASIDADLDAVLNGLRPTSGGSSASSPAGPAADAPLPRLPGSQSFVSQSAVAAVVWVSVLLPLMTVSKKRPSVLGAKPTLATSVELRRRRAAKVGLIVGVVTFVLGLGGLIAADAAGLGHFREFDPHDVGAMAVLAPGSLSGWIALITSGIVRLTYRLKFGPPRPAATVAAASTPAWEPDFSRIGETDADDTVDMG